MKKVVLKLDLHDDRAKQRAMRRVSGLSGVDSISMDMKDQKLTVTGDVDPVVVVRKLRKLCPTNIVSVGEPEKKKEEPKKEEAKKTEEKKKDPNDVSELVKAYKAYNPHMTTYYHVRSVEEDPNACVIC